MPIRVKKTPGDGPTYGDVRAGAYNNVHQIKLAVSGLSAAADADGYIPPGLPIRNAGTVGALVSGADQSAVVIGPEAVRLGAADHFANVILDGPLNRGMIEANIGRVLSANELAALTAAGFVFAAPTA